MSRDATSNNSPILSHARAFPIKLKHSFLICTRAETHLSQMRANWFYAIFVRTHPNNRKINPPSLARFPLCRGLSSTRFSRFPSRRKLIRNLRQHWTIARKNYHLDYKIPTTNRAPPLVEKLMCTNTRRPALYLSTPTRHRSLWIDRSSKSILSSLFLSLPIDDVVRHFCAKHTSDEEDFSDFTVISSYKF